MLYGLYDSTADSLNNGSFHSPRAWIATKYTWNHAYPTALLTNAVLQETPILIVAKHKYEFNILALLYHCLQILYLPKYVVWLVCMATTFRVAPTGALWCAKAGKFYVSYLPSMITLEVDLGFLIVFCTPIRHWWLPFRNISTDTPCCSFHHRDSGRITAPLLKYNQKVPRRIKPWTRNVVPEQAWHEYKGLQM